MGGKKAPHAYRQGLNKEKKGIRSIWECAENTSQSRWWKQTEKYLTEVMHIKNNGFSTEKGNIEGEEHEWKCGCLDRLIFFNWESHENCTCVCNLDFFCNISFLIDT